MSDLDLTAWLCDALEADSVELDLVQELWEGYGDLYRVAPNGPHPAAILKRIDPSRPGPAGDQASHRRKLVSYMVETRWYRDWASLTDPDCRVPALLGSHVSDDALLILLEDLGEAGFPVQVSAPREEHLDMCLFWLAHFHARFLGAKPEGLWKKGTYWHLETRRREHEAMPGGDLKRRAEKIDRKLSRARHRTLVHGDAKPENFLFSKTGRAAAVDFQYVGGGCAMKDVAYLLWGCPSQTERELVDLYFDHLRVALAEKKPNAPFDDIEREWRDLMPYAKDDFERFLKGWLVTR